MIKIKKRILLYWRWALRVLLLLHGIAVQAQTVPTPEQVLGFVPGEDYQLADYHQIVYYFELLERTSDRIELQNLGQTTLGNSFIMAIITSPENHARLEALKEIQQKLADPRKVNDEEVPELIKQGKTIVLINCTIHSTEIGPSQMALNLAYRLAAETSLEVNEILDNVILLLVPVHNPDGQVMVVDWYKKYLGTPYEGCSLPWLYHVYTGHDINRDWFMFTQVETRMTVEKIHNVWHPQITLDMHQMPGNSARQFVPPYLEPIDPNVDSILVEEIAWLGQAIAAELTAQGKPGVVTQALYDAWTPARAYPHYHGGIRILSETASCNLASPDTIQLEEIQSAVGFTPRKATPNHPLPWNGGRWGLNDIVAYTESVAWAVLSHAAKHRKQWLQNFYQVGKRAISPQKDLFAFVIPAKQKHLDAVAEMLRILKTAQVEIHKAKESFVADGTLYGPEAYIIKTAQPYGAFARTMLGVQHYPRLEGWSIRKSYDITAHSLPRLLGVKTVAIKKPFKVKADPVDNVLLPEGNIVGRKANYGYIISHESNGSFIILNRLLKRGCQVYWAAEAFRTSDQEFPAGTLIVPGKDNYLLMESFAREFPVEVFSIDVPPAVSAYGLKQPRLGLYKSWVASMDEGWTRWILEKYEFQYQNIYDVDIRKGGLKDSFDVLIFPDQSAEIIVNGHSPQKMPPEYCGGIGSIGLRHLKAFVEAGGTLITLDSASELPVKYFGIKVTNILTGVKEDKFYCPGSILRLLLDTRHPIVYGYQDEVAGLFVNSPAFVAEEGYVVARYPPEEPLLLSGLLHGGELLYDKAALIEVPFGKGKLILFGFPPQFRAQTLGTFKLLFNSIFYSTATLR